jgi:hypothetical protein
MRDGSADDKPATMEEAMERAIDNVDKIMGLKK